MQKAPSQSGATSGTFVTRNGERFYAIGNVDSLAPFFISLVSDSDHWMFVSSNGGLTAGRVSPETALFPYVTVDKIYDSTAHTGSKTIVRMRSEDRYQYWEPFNQEHDGRYATTRNLYKNVLGNKLLFEEINHDLQLAFRYSWMSSNEYGFVRQSEIENLGAMSRKVELVDGLANLLPAGTPLFAQTNTSYLVDAYKWSELDAPTGLALFSLFSGITDRPAPCESLRATTVFRLGLEKCQILLSDGQLGRFRAGEDLTQETHTRGIRGAYFVSAAPELAPQSPMRWQIVANIEQSQSDAVDLQRRLADPQALGAEIARSVASGSDALARIMAAADGFQMTAEENVSAHHYANALYNVLRGGIVDDQYRIATRDFAQHVRRFNRAVWQRHQAWLEDLPEKLALDELRVLVQKRNDDQLERLRLEYLPITFGRRHGDPSRPWNRFAIRLTDEEGKRLLSYEGNWRDIFQNWEALLFGFPEFIENIVAKFVNASTADGYNPYRITSEGIDWEVEDLEDPWSYIGYWGDHQIIYLLKFLEASRQFHPARMSELLLQPVYSYANVPYRIKPFEAIIANAKDTVVYDQELAQRIEERGAEIGADARLLHNADGQVVQVSLLEKLLVPLLAKLGNLVPDGGIWLNTQRPEWNDANNALVGQGLSMVTLYYLRRYIRFLQQLLADAPGIVSLSSEVSRWLEETAAPLHAASKTLSERALDAKQRYAILAELGQAASHFRETLYAQESLSGPVTQDLAPVNAMLDDALTVIDYSIRQNQRDDGLYHAYNLLNLTPDAAEVSNLYLMLEGQVAVLSSGAIAPAAAVELLEALFASSLFRPDQRSFLLYPDHELPGFLEKNCVPQNRVDALPVLQKMLAQGERRIIERDAAGTYRFNAGLSNVGQLEARLDELAPTWGEELKAARDALRTLYEDVFEHKLFTGRSGGMFGFEGLGSIYWHMVAKLLLAVQENFFAARESNADEAICRQLGDFYYRIRKGIGFNKTPGEYGAFPIDPYSHTPKHAGAQQPGMTGQVKEEILTRFGELGLRVHAGQVAFDLSLLRALEFLDAPALFRYLDVDEEWQSLEVPTKGLAFTWCQVPIVYRLDETAAPAVTVIQKDGSSVAFPALCLPAEIAQQVFCRSGQVRRIELVLGSRQLFSA